MKNEKQVEFEGKVVKCIYSKIGSDWSIYAMDVDSKKYPAIKQNQYENVSISGELGDLSVTRPYMITAVEQENKYGVTYQVSNIKIMRPRTGEEIYSFLREILTDKQAAALYKEYPDIIDLVSNEKEADVDLSKLPGIGEKTFGKIKKKIMTNIVLLDLVVEFGGILSLNVIKKLYDEYPSLEMIRKKLRTDPYKCLTRISGIGFIKADQILLELESEKKIDFGFNLKKSPQRCSACMEYYIEENQNDGNTKMDLRDLRKQVMKLVPLCANHFVDCLKTNDFYYDKETFDVALKTTYETEKYIAEKIISANKNHKIWDIDWKKYQTEGEHPLTDEQISALECICNNNIMILNGFGGSGKSATSAMIIKMLEDNDITYKLLAPTGRAAKVLADYTERPAATIHRGLGYMPPSTWAYNEECPITSRVVLIDEFSMTDVFLFKRVIDAIDFNVTKLIMIGDSAQLPSVGPGNLLHDFVRSKKIPVITLNKIFRYGEGGLMTVATDIRNKKKYLTDKPYQIFGDKQDYMFMNVTNEEIVDKAIKLYEKLLENYKPENILVLSAYNKGNCGTIMINNKLQVIANVNYGSKDFVQVGEVKYLNGDIVIQTANNYHAPIYYEDMDINNLEAMDDLEETFIPNGMLGKIISIKKDMLIINFDGVNVVYSKTDMQHVALGYSISIHKSQGGSGQVIILLSPSSHEFMMNSNLLYVGVTRTKDRCFHLGNIASINRAINKKENYNRKTFMFNMLVNDTKINSKN